MMLGRETTQPVDLMFNGERGLDEFEAEAAYMYVAQLEDTLKTAHSVARKNLDILQGTHLASPHFKPPMKLAI